VTKLNTHIIYYTILAALIQIPFPFYTHLSVTYLLLYKMAKRNQTIIFASLPVQLETLSSPTHCHFYDSLINLFNYLIKQMKNNLNLIAWHVQC